jgi:hypothetical protein
MKFFAAVQQGLTCYDWAKFALFNGKGKGYVTPALKKQLNTLKESAQYRRMDPKKQTVACYDRIPEISKLALLREARANMADVRQSRSRMEEFEQNSAN